MSNGGWNWLTSNASILNNVANNLIPVENLITGAAYLVGVSFAFKAIHTLKAYGEGRSAMSSQHGGMKEALVYFMIAAVFIYFPSVLSTFFYSSFGYSSPLEYQPINSSNSALSTLFGTGSIIGRPLSIIIQVIGLIAFFRGWLILARGAQGQQAGSTGKGMMHIVGGILAINIVGTLNIVNNTLFGTG